VKIQWWVAVSELRRTVKTKILSRNEVGPYLECLFVDSRKKQTQAQ